MKRWLYNPTFCNIIETFDTETPLATNMTEKDNSTVDSTIEDFVEPANDTMGDWNVTIDNEAATGIDPHTKSKRYHHFILC